MSHYKNGREAKVGDSVVGTTFNTSGAIIVGTLLSIIPGPDACSALVGFTYLEKVGEDGKFPINYDTLVKIQGTSNHGNSGEQAVTRYKQDYTDCKSLLHADDAWELAGNYMGLSK